ncbi:MAG: methyltransferase [Vibrionaceae bacterium]|nr:methyltransferase [Vibrionaceae bacterium]
MKNIKTRALVAVGVLTASASAFASGGPDAGAVTTIIAGFGAFVAAVGGAMVLISVAKKAWSKIGG